MEVVYIGISFFCYCNIGLSFHLCQLICVSAPRGTWPGVSPLWTSALPPFPTPQYLQDAVNSDTELKFTVPSLVSAWVLAHRHLRSSFYLEDVYVQAPHRLHFSRSRGFVCLLLFLFFPSCARVFIVGFAKSYGSDYALVFLYVYVGIYKIIHWYI